MDVNSEVLAIYDGQNFNDEISEVGKQYGIILDKTPFYAEQGGQEYDTGKLVIDGETEFNVTNVQVYGGYVLHTGQLVEGSLKLGSNVISSYDELRRFPLRNNHTGTHMLNFALMSTLGNDVDQKGSLVAPEKLRFDFSHKKALSFEELVKVEDIVNEQIKQNMQIYYKEVSLDLAKKISSLRAVFGETYPDPVRVVSVGKPVEDMLVNPESEEWKNYSVEFCGGTHVSKTGEIKQFVIIEESGIAKGIRRIVAVSGSEALEVQRLATEYDAHLDQAAKMPTSPEKEKKLKELGVSLKTLQISTIQKQNLVTKFNTIEKVMKDELKLKAKKDTQLVLDLVSKHFTENEEVKYFAAHVDIPTNSKAITEAINVLKKNKSEKVLYLITGNEENKLGHACYVPDSLLETVKPQEVTAKSSELIGGKTGGKGNIVQGNGLKLSEVEKAVEAVNELLASKLTI
ncbi:Alanine--tRNA ligase [Hanseniaspora valbyensis]